MNSIRNYDTNLAKVEDLARKERKICHAKLPLIELELSTCLWYNHLQLSLL